MGLHRAAQLALPITIAGAGLPSLAALAGQARSYAERMFSFRVLGSLDPAQVRDGLDLPAAGEGVRWTEDAIARVIDVTEGIPYLLQEFGKKAWDAAVGPDTIDLGDVERSIPAAMAELDDGFFRFRTGRISNPEKAYLRAMAELSPGPVRSGAVATLLGKKITALGPTRENLIRKALCYAPRWGEIDFTVPLFDRFMKRWIPDLASVRD
jgi:hypothetical protein